MIPRPRAQAPIVVMGATGLLSTATLILAWLNGRAPEAFIEGNQANTWLAGAAFGVVGALVLRAQPANRLGPIFAVAAVLGALCAFFAEYAVYVLRTDKGALPGADLAALLGAVLWMPAFLLLLTAVPLLFPGGRLPSPRWRLPARFAFGAGVVAVVGVATSGYVVADEFPEASNPLDLPFPDDVQIAVALPAFFAVLAVGAVATGALAVRMRRVPYHERSRYAWFVAAIGLALANGVLSLPGAISLIGNILTVAAIGVGIVRHQLFDIELVLSRALVYAVLTAGALVAYLAVAALMGAGTVTGVGPALAAAVAALLLASVRQRVQRWMDRLLYGERGDPLGVLTALGERLGQALDADAVLPAVVETVRQTLRLPYAAVHLADEPGPAYASGEAPAHLVRFTLAHAGELVGELIVGLRRGETAAAPADARLIETFARQVGVAAHGVRVTRDLRRSREQIVGAREEERRRLRRDLHDGIGPALAGITLGLETAGRITRREGSPAVSLLESLCAEASGCVEQIRQVVADLRPPALDEIGLVATLRQRAELLSRSSGTLTVEVVSEETLPVLPAAVEVAAYRIASEAMTNAIRHSGGRVCRVSVILDGDLRLAVQDDGAGRLPSGHGVGLISMRDRAEEVGGTCLITFREGKGTSVEAVLPVETP